MVELLVAISLFLIASAAATKLLTLGFEALAMYQHRVETARILLDLQRTWQRGCSDSDSSRWTTDGTAFDTGESKFSTEPGKLNVERGGKSLPFYLPKGVRVQFSVEREPSTPARAILRCDWTSHWLDQHRTHSVRMVACGEEER